MALQWAIAPPLAQYTGTDTTHCWLVLPPINGANIMLILVELIFDSIREQRDVDDGLQSLHKERDRSNNSHITEVIMHYLASALRMNRKEIFV